MKNIFFAVALTVFSASALAREAISFDLSCNLRDLGKPHETSNIFTANVNLKANGSVDLPSYLGHKYEVSADDVSNAAPRVEFGVAARNLADNQLVASAKAVYSADAPNLILREGVNIFLRCTLQVH
jgi:hypothetical protein